MAIAPEEARRVAADIANGHAYEKHVRQEAAFPNVEARGDFAALIERILLEPSAEKLLPRGRRAFWDDATQTIVIVDPRNPDFGTAFTPADGKAYFTNLIAEEAP